MTVLEITSVMKNMNIPYGYTGMIKCIGAIALHLLLGTVDIISCRKKNQNQTLDRYQDTRPAFEQSNGLE